MKKSLLTIIIIAAALALADYSCNTEKKPEIIGLNQNIHHDDFEYSVTEYTTAHVITTERDTIPAQGRFYIVHFKVINKAMRVGHQWDNSIAYIVDERGNLYENLKTIQIAINEKNPFGYKEIYNTPHGESDTTIFIFDIPADSKEPYLKVRGEILMGDAFDKARFRRIKVKLF